MTSFDLGDGVVARRWDVADAAAAFAVIDANRDHLVRWMPWVPHTTSDYDVASFIRESEIRFRDGRGIDFGVFERGRVLGGFGASIGALNYDEADIGYWLATDAQGRGLATGSSRRLIDWLFDERDMHRITIRARIDNERSRAVAERLGFTLEGVLREALLVQEAHHDAALYSLLRSEWPEPGAGSRTFMATVSSPSSDISKLTRWPWRSVRKIDPDSEPGRSRASDWSASSTITPKPVTGSYTFTTPWAMPTP
jgi:ribosomal-protein-serine acetyltransferase